MNADPASPETFGQTVRALFARPGPVLMAGLLLALVVARAFQGPLVAADLIAITTVLLAWPFVEWLIHVHLLHAAPRTLLGWRIDLPVSRRHREHHRDPADLRAITIDVRVFPVVVPLLFLLAYGLSPSAALATTILAAIFGLGLHYEFCHFVAHVRWRPALRYYQGRQRAHRLHHYRNDTLWWGVSTGWADRILGTAPEERRVERSVERRGTTHALEDLESLPGRGSLGNGAAGGMPGGADCRRS